MSRIKIEGFGYAEKVEDSLLSNPFSVTDVMSDSGIYRVYIGGDKAYIAVIARGRFEGEYKFVGIGSSLSDTPYFFSSVLRAITRYNKYIDDTVNRHTGIIRFLCNLVPEL